jgi:hypothetical protein
MIKSKLPEGTLDELKFLSQLTDTFMFVFRINDKALSDSTITGMAIEMSTDMLDLLKDPNIYIDNKVPDSESLAQKCEDIYQQQYSHLSNYKKLVICHGLIMCCSIFEEFLKDLLESVLHANPNLTLWCTKNDILSQFAQQSIKGKVAVLKNKFNIKEEEFFNFSLFTPQIQKKFYGINSNDLIKVFKKRDVAAHTVNCPIDSLDELRDIRELFEKLIFILSSYFRKKWKIKSGIVHLYSNS